MRAAAKQSKQTTLDNLPEAPKKELAKAVVHEQKKQIVITEISSVTKEDELDLKVEFKLLPSKMAFTKLNADLFFDGQKMSGISVRIPQSPIVKNDFEINPVFKMRGIGAGSHVIKVEMYELWSSGEKLTLTSKEATIEYAPVRKEDRLIEVPIVKSIAGGNLTVVSDSEKNIYREMEENMKREEASKRDDW
jgi:hypothetical protein